MVSKARVKVVRGELLWVNKSSKVPRWLPSGKSKGPNSAMRGGLVYEAQFVKYIAAKYGEELIEHGPWFSYADDFGQGWCQPDFLVYPDKSRPLIIGECKRTAKAQAVEKLQGLYYPVVLKWLGGLPNVDDMLINGVRLVQVCKFVKPDFDGLVVSDLAEAFDKSSPDMLTLCFPKIPKV